MINTKIDAASDMSGKLAMDANSLNKLKLSAKDNSPEAIKQVAKQFESIFVNMMLKSMRDASPQDGPFDNEQSRTYTAMLDQQLSQTIASKGIGLADVLAKQLSKTGYGTHPETSDMDLGTSPDITELKNLLNKQPVRDTPNPAPANTSLTPDSFEEKMAGAANEASQATGIPSNYILGHAALESGWGKREIKGADGQTSYNLFGIKATANWTGKTVDAVTTEYVHGVKQIKVEKFRAYDSYADAFKDFGNLMRNNPRYSKVLNNLQDGGSYAKAVQAAGYATDPDYATKLSQVIKQVTSA
ncbi:flagellar assembly peptidoglycan hydrolase FlgJ [Methyloradius palustris]|uniref:Peptidoglycan hydrolase FlgJ n=1 Tax=Methyloradius palustris TaxID=2778876 RepID=A0A8D5G3R4_9PROT|nr:flagellar assembly peptidoglycan hydrolase FlgJ [Methyloradius palustris]BCM25463.1 flagellar rod assembly protein/muramidase FlgJ [Methyloradius palustris]